MRELLRRIWRLVRRDRFEADLAEEMAFHRELKQQELESSGEEAHTASAAARNAFGSTALAQDQSRDVWVPRALQGLGQDLRLAIRTLWSTRLVSGVAILSLALGLGANTAIFTLIDSLLLRPLPVADPARLVTIAAEGSATVNYWSYPIWQQFEARRDLVDGMFAWSNNRFNLASEGEAQFVDGAWATGGFFRTLGVQPWLGRAFGDADDRAGGGPDGPVAVVGYRFWRDRLGGTVDAVGRRLVVEGVPFTVIGVMPPQFYGVEVGRDLDIVVPMSTEPLMMGRDNTRFAQTGRYWLQVMARLKTPDATGTIAALRAVQPQIREATMPSNLPPDVAAKHFTEPLTLLSARAGTTGTSNLRDRYGRPLVTILVVVALVLLIASANIANLMLARADARWAEISLHRALGASRWRIGRRLLIESALIAVLGAAAGLAVASWTSRLLVGKLLVGQLSGQSAQIFLDLTINWRVLAFTTIAAVLSALLFGVAPSMRAAHVEPMTAIRGGSDRTRSHAGRLAAGFIVAQVALSLMLVVTAGLFVRTFAALVSHDLGFERGHVLLVGVNAVRAPVAPADRIAMYDRARDAVAAVPGVAAVGVTGVTPAANIGMMARITVPGGSLPNITSAGGNAYTNIVSPGAFGALGIPLIAGRDFTARDRADTPLVAIVNETFVRRGFNGANPIGATVTARSGRGQTPPIEIVGVVRDSVYRSVRETSQPTIYQPLTQSIMPSTALATLTLIVRSSGVPPGSLTRSVAAAVSTASPGLSLATRPLDDQVDGSLAQERLLAVLSGWFGGLALLLAALGLYGVASYAVTRRRREIGIRMSLGATAGGVMTLVLGRISRLVGIGIVLGAVGGAWASTFVAALLYGVEPRDPGTIVVSALVMMAVGAIAAWVPARRAARIDPAITLRCE